MTGTAALLTAIGFPQLIPSLVQELFIPDSIDEENLPEESESTEQQTIEVRFIVYTQDYAPVDKARVRFVFDGAPVHRYTDSNGYVSIKIPKREDIEVIIDKEGFTTNRQILNLQADSGKTISINLQEKEAENPVESLDSDEPEEQTSKPSETNEVSWELVDVLPSGFSTYINPSSIRELENGLVRVESRHDIPHKVSIEEYNSAVITYGAWLFDCHNVMTKGEYEEDYDDEGNLVASRTQSVWSGLQPQTPGYSVYLRVCRE